MIAGNEGLTEEEKAELLYEMERDESDEMVAMRAAMRAVENDDESEGDA